MRFFLAISLLLPALALVAFSGSAHTETGNHTTYFDVKDYGARGDGSTNDSAAFQAAIDAAHKAGGGTVIVPKPPSSYLLGSDIQLKNNVSMIASSPFAAIKLGPHVDIIVRKNLSVSGLKFDNSAAGHAQCIKFDEVPSTTETFREYNVTIENNWFYGCSQGIFAAHHIADVAVRNNIFENGSYGIYAFNVNRFKIEGNHFKGSFSIGINASNVKNSMITNNTFKGDGNVSVEGILLGLENALNYAGGTYGNIITGNHVENVTDECILLEEYQGKAYRDGGRVDSATSSAITDNAKLLTYNDRVTDFRTGGILRGTSSSASGTVFDDKKKGSGGTLTLKNVSGAFINNEAIEGSPSTARSSGAAVDKWSGGSLQNMDICIVEGTGAGQCRIISSNTPSAITVDRPWDVIPDSTSYYWIGRALRNNVISHNNTYNCGKQGIMIYGPALHNVINGNVVRKAGMKPTGGPYYGILLMGTHGQNNMRQGRSTVMWNIISNNSIFETYSGKGYGGIAIDIFEYLPPDFFALGNSIVGNTISSTPTGIEISRALLTQVRNNVVSFADVGVKETSSTDNSHISDNAFVNVKTPVLAIGSKTAVNH